MTIRIEIATHDNRLTFDILEKDSAGLGDTVTISENAVLEYRGGIIRKTEGLPEILNFVLHVGEGIAIGVVASWIYNRLANRATRLRINRTEIEIDEGEITRIITENIEEN